MVSSDSQTLIAGRVYDSERVNETPEETQLAAWGFAHKVAFRFAFCYLCLYLYPFSSTLGWYWSMWLRWKPIETPWSQMVPWVAAYVLHWGHSVSMSLMADSPYGYVKLFCRALIALLATLVWSLIDRRSVAYAKLDQWIHLWVRIVLAFTMISFGACKIIPVQAPFPDLVTLLQPYGDVGSSRFFWDFLGVSSGYQTFAAFFETAAGVLLLVPGLTTLGALMSFGAMVAVFTQSGFFGVPDKLVQLHLILFALLLVVPDIPRLMNTFVLNRRAEPERRTPLFRQSWMNYSVWGIEWALGAYIIVHMVTWGSATWNEMKSLPVKTPFYGIWTVDEFIADGQVRPPLLNDKLRWQRMIVDCSPAIKEIPETMVATIQQMNGDFSPYVASVDTKNDVLSLKSPSEADLATLARMFIHTGFRENQNAQLHYNQPSPDKAVLDGVVDGHRLFVTLKKEEREFVLRDIKFHWVIEDKDIHY
jgi:hypothetical protein